MTDIGSMLDPTTAANLRNVVADLQMDTKAKGSTPKATAPKAKVEEVPFVIIKAATDPNPPRRLTVRDAIEIDPESEALIDALCVDCRVPLLIDPKVPEGVDPTAPRVPICDGCADVRTRFAAISQQRNVATIRRTTVAKHRPRLTDGIEHPVTTAPSTTTSKENDMDLDNMSDAELGATIRQQMRMAAADALKPKRKKAKKAQAEAETKARKGIKAEQERRKGHVLPAFMVGTGLEVPALDLSEVPSLDECPDSKTRSPYNKARFRLTKERPLDPEETTYRVLESEHLRLMSAAATHNTKAEPKAEPKKKGKKAKKATVNVIADLDPSVEAKVTALAKLTGISEQEARAIVVG